MSMSIHTTAIVRLTLVSLPHSHQATELDVKILFYVSTPPTCKDINAALTVELLAAAFNARERIRHCGNGLNNRSL